MRITPAAGMPDDRDGTDLAVRFPGRPALAPAAFRVPTNGSDSHNRRAPPAQQGVAAIGVVLARTEPASARVPGTL
jgi:hypothetical protein